MAPFDIQSFDEENNSDDESWPLHCCHPYSFYSKYTLQLNAQLFPLSRSMSISKP